MDLRQLRYFLEIVEQGSLSAAARTLHVAQPALSLHLRNMEEALDTVLLLRKPGGVEPTEAGTLLAARARGILKDMARTEDEIRHLDKSPGGPVRLGLPGTLSDILTLPLIEALRQDYPRITLNVADAMSGFVTGWLEEGRVDLAVLHVAPGGAVPEGDGLVEEELVLIRAPGMAGQVGVSLQELREMPLILPSVGHGLRDLVAHAAQAAQVPLEVTMEIDSYRSIKTLVARGYGASILPLYAVHEEIAGGVLSCVPFTGSPLRRVAVLRRSGSATRACRAVADTIHRVTRTLVQQGRWGGTVLSGSGNEEVPG